MVKISFTIPVIAENGAICLDPVTYRSSSEAPSSVEWDCLWDVYVGGNVGVLIVLLHSLIALHTFPQITFSLVRYRRFSLLTPGVSSLIDVLVIN